MAELEPDYESRQDAILRFVSKSPNCTKADVIRHMKGKSALTTTHAILKDLIRDGKITVYKKNLQTHLLTINRGNEFIWINNKLADVYEFIERCERIAKKLDVFKEKNLPELRKKKAISEKMEFQYFLFLQKFIPPMDAMLHRLLYRTIDTIKSEKDAQILNRKVLDLIQKLYEMPLFLKSTPDLEDRLNIYPQYNDRAINSNIDEINSNIQALKKQKQNLPLLTEYETLTNDFKQMADIYMKDFINTLRALHDSQA